MCSWWNRNTTNKKQWIWIDFIFSNFFIKAKLFQSGNQFQNSPYRLISTIQIRLVRLYFSHSFRITPHGISMSHYFRNRILAQKSTVRNILEIFLGFCVLLGRYCGGIFQIEEVMRGWSLWESRTLKPVIIIPPRGTSSHALPRNHNPLYHKAQICSTKAKWWKTHLKNISNLLKNLLKCSKVWLKQHMALDATLQEKKGKHIYLFFLWNWTWHWWLWWHWRVSQFTWNNLI